MAVRFSEPLVLFQSGVSGAVGIPLVQACVVWGGRLGSLRLDPGCLSVGEQHLRPVEKVNTLPGRLFLVWLPFSSPLSVVQGFPVVVRGTPVWFGGRNESPGLPCPARLGLVSFFCCMGDIRCPVACCFSASRATDPFAFLPHFGAPFWWFLALFPEFIVALSGQGAGKHVYTILSRLES